MWLPRVMIVGSCRRLDVAWTTRARRSRSAVTMSRMFNPSTSRLPACYNFRPLGSDCPDHRVCAAPYETISFTSKILVRAITRSHPWSAATLRHARPSSAAKGRSIRAAEAVTVCVVDIRLLDGVGRHRNCPPASGLDYLLRNYECEWVASYFGRTAGRAVLRPKSADNQHVLPGSQA